MISLDKGLLGGGNVLGDVVDRHKLYGDYVNSLDIVVMNTGKLDESKISEKVISYPTNSKSRFLYFLDAYKIALKIYKKNKFDLIVCQDPFLTGLTGVMLKRKTRAKLVVGLHGDFFSNKYWLKESWFNPMLFLIGRHVVKKADGVRAVSDKVVDDAFKIIKSKNRTYKISTPVNLEKMSAFNSDNIRKIKSRYNDKKIVIFVGRLVESKNLSLLLDSFSDVIKKYKDAVLLILGDGELKNDLMKKIKKDNLGLSVFLLGQVDHRLLSDFYKASEFSVLPSTNESFGKVLLEASSVKKTSISSDTVGGKEIIKDNETGFIVPINDKDALSKKMLTLLKNSKLCDKMGENAYNDIFNRYEYKKNVKKIIKMWRDVITK